MTRYRYTVTAEYTGSFLADDLTASEVEEITVDTALEGVATILDVQVSEEDD